MAVEDDELSNPVEFARDLTSPLRQPDTQGITGLLIARLKRASGFGRHLLEQILARQAVLRTIPVVANMDFGHTSPLATLPIGGEVQLSAADEPQLRVLAHLDVAVPRGDGPAGSWTCRKRNVERAVVPGVTRSPGDPLIAVSRRAQSMIGVPSKPISLPDSSDPLFFFVSLVLPVGTGLAALIVGDRRRKAA